MDSDNLFQGLNMFTQGLQQLAVSRTLAKANDAVDQVRNSEADDAAKNAQLRQIAQGMTFQLAAQGVPGSTLQTLAGFAPPKPNPQNPFEAYALGGQYKQAAQDYQQSVKDTALEEAQAKYDALLRNSLELQGLKNQGKQAAAEVKPDYQAEKIYNTAIDKIQPDDKTRSAFAQNALIKQSADKLRATTNGATDQETLNKLNPTLIKEIGGATAQLITQGKVSDEALHTFIPATSGMDKATAAQYVTNHPEAANQAGFVQQFLHIADREAAVAQSNIEESVLQRATEKASTLNMKPEQTKNAIAKVLNISPDDVIVEKNNVTTVQKQARDQKFNEIYSGVKDLKASLNSKDTATKNAALQKASVLKNQYGIDVNDSINQLKEHIAFKVKAGAL